MKVSVYRAPSITALTLALAFSCTRLEEGGDVFGSEEVTGGAPARRGTGGAASAVLGGSPSASGGASPGSDSGRTGTPELPVGAGGTSILGSGSGAPNLEAGSAGSGGESCIDRTGFDGLGCNTCPPVDIVDLENACTSASCTRFDNEKRLPGLGSDGQLPALAAADGGTAGGGGVSGSGGIAGSGASAGSLAGRGGTGAGGTGGAGSACAALASKGSVVYITGSSASRPFLQQIARQLVGNSAFIVYTSTGSCVGVDAILNGTPMKSGPPPAPATSATYWDSPSSTGIACDLPAAGITADIGISDVFAQTCPGFELTNPDRLQVRDAHGPIQTMTFAVPASSPYREISAQAAYFVFGFGKDGNVLDPEARLRIWNDETQILPRSASSGTQAMIAAAIGLPSTRFRGKSHRTSDEVAAALQAASGDPATATKAIGILAADYIDTENLRAQIRVLAYQDSRQTCAVYPDSTAGARDKQNVRDGHYPIWGPLHLFHKVDGAGNPVNAASRQQIVDIIGYLAGSKPLPNGVRLIDVYGQGGLVPECAMRVTRTKDGGNIVPFRPTNPCSCLFDVVATGTTTCKPCSVQGGCDAGQTCSLGYCED